MDSKQKSRGTSAVESFASSVHRVASIADYAQNAQHIVDGIDMLRQTDDSGYLPSMSELRDLTTEACQCNIAFFSSSLQATQPCLKSSCPLNTQMEFNDIHDLSSVGWDNHFSRALN